MTQTLVHLFGSLLITILSLDIRVRRGPNR